MCVICDIHDEKASWDQFDGKRIEIECKTITKFVILLPARSVLCINCPNLITIDTDEKYYGRVRVKDCPKLENITGKVEYLSISNCPAIQAIPKRVADCLEIDGASEFAKTLFGRIPHNKSVSTRWLIITHCPDISLIPTIPALRKLYVHSCPFLSEIPNQTSLFVLDLRGCPFVYVSGAALRYDIMKHKSKQFSRQILCKIGRKIRDAAQRARETVCRRAEVAHILDKLLIPPLIKIILAKVTFASYP